MTIHKFFEHLYLAVTFMTRLPLPNGRRELKETLAAASYCFPLAGLLIGLGMSGVVWILAETQLNPALIAILAIAFAACLTGALHEDGLADCADGFGGGQDRDRKLAIMKDSRIGSYGVLALILIVALKIVAITDLVTTGIVPLTISLVLAHSLSRATLPLTMAIQSSAKTSGLGSAAGVVTLTTALGGLLLSLILSVLLLGITASMGMLLVAACASIAVAALSWFQIGGYTGDSLGAQQQITETAIILFLTTCIFG